MSKMVSQELMPDKSFPEVITLCGSTKFKEQFLEIQKKLTLEGKIVISVGLFAHADNEQLTKEQKILVDQVYLKKIDLADTIYVIDINCYIGDSTRNEIEYAKSKGKNIKFYSKEK